MAPVQHVCSHCHKRLLVINTPPGKRKGRCPSCSTRLRFPQAVSAAVQTAQPASLAARPEAKRPPATPSPGLRRWLPVVWGPLIGLCAATLLVGVVLTRLQSNPRPSRVAAFRDQIGKPAENDAAPRVVQGPTIPTPKQQVEKPVAKEARQVVAVLQLPNRNPVVSAAPIAKQITRPVEESAARPPPGPLPQPITVVPQVKQEPRQSKVVVKRRQMLEEEQLKDKILKATEVTLDLTNEREESTNLAAAVQRELSEEDSPRLRILKSYLRRLEDLDLTKGREDSTSLTAEVRRELQDELDRRTNLTPTLLRKRTNLAGLPWRMGKDCKLDKAAADQLQTRALELRRAMSGPLTTPSLREALATKTPVPDNHWLKAEAIPTLMQLLTGEDKHVRAILVEHLSGIDGQQSSTALANRAVFDLDAGVRQAAIEALAARPKDEYQQVLVDGLSHPWAVMADHASEAVVALDVREALPGLVGLLDAPDPAAPYQKPNSPGKWFVKEMVRVNHLRNCVMCHAPSFSPDDKVRGLMPSPEQELPPRVTQHYYNSQPNGIFVHADVTYLRQDSSALLPVPNSRPWPEEQRFDLLVREQSVDMDMLRQLNAALLVKDNKLTPHRAALFFALRGLTGKDAGLNVKDWKQLFVMSPP
jgi:HEAT repeats